MFWKLILSVLPVVCVVGGFALAVLLAKKMVSWARKL